MPREPALAASEARMAKRSRHGASGGQDARSERPAMGHGQPRPTSPYAAPHRKSAMQTAILTTLIMLAAAPLPAAEPAVAAARPDLAFPGETIDEWHGAKRHAFQFAGRLAWVVEPQEPLPGNPWSWCLMFPDAFTTRCAAPQLVAAGFHHAFKA